LVNQSVVFTQAALTDYLARQGLSAEVTAAPVKPAAPQTAESPAESEVEPGAEAESEVEPGAVEVTAEASAVPGDKAAVEEDNLS
jgi:hypothetical protein